MRKITYILLIAIVCSSIIIATAGRGQEISSSDHNIIITTSDDSLTITETIILQSSSSEGFYEIIWPWIQTDAENVEIKIDGTTVSNELVNDVGINISSLNIELGSTPTLELTYSLDNTLETFQKTLQRDTGSITVTYDAVEIYSSTDLTSGNSFSLSLTKLKETVTEKEETPITYTIIIIGLLVIIIILVILFSRKKPKTTITKKDTIGGTEELLSTRKALLMTLLKDIEKQHRAKEISDDTYHKLKEQYKQEAVNTMKQLEDIKSKT